MREEPIYLVTDQGPATGIGVYTEALLNLLHGTFPNLTLLSLCYLPGQERQMWKRLPQSKLAHHWSEIPFVIRHNYFTLRKQVPKESPIHFCGTSYREVVNFSHSIVTVHDFYPRVPTLTALRNPRVLLRDLSALKQFVELPNQVRTARARIVPTRYVQERLHSGSLLLSTAIHHWIDSSRFYPRNKRDARDALGLPSENSLILNVSTGSSNKNYGLLERIASKLKEECRIVIAGGSYIRIPNTIPLARLPHDLYPLLFNACDVYLHTSTSEGFGWPLIEAMASDLPVVALGTAVSMEVLGGAGLFVGPEEGVEHWTDKIYNLLRDPLRSEVIDKERARRTVFDLEHARREYEAVYLSSFF